MLKKIHSIKVLTTGQGKNGPWTLVEIACEGQEGVYKGFYYEKPLVVGQEIDVEFSTEEYKGQMENRFKILTKSAQAVSHAVGMTEMAIKTEVARYGQEILRKLDLIMVALNVRDFKAEVEEVRNQEPMKPTWEKEITPDEIPF